MGQVVNLRTIRKRAVRQQADDRAAENRLKHGQSKTQVMLGAARSAKAGRDLDGHRLDSGDQE
jgi:hypothetical protein